MATGTGTDLAMNAAAVVLMDRRLDIQFVLQLSRKTMLAILRKISWAFFYNSVGFVFADHGRAESDTRDGCHIIVERVVNCEGRAAQPRG
jgi:cation transport ATPase